MKKLISLTLELLVRYACAVVIGLVFLLFDWHVASRFLNHLGMHGILLVYELSILMLFAVPAWMLLVGLLKFVVKGPALEIVIAGLVAIAAAQFHYFDLFWQNFILPTVDSGTKGEMLIWYVAMVTNYMLATMLFCVMQWIWLKIKPASPAMVDVEMDKGGNSQ